MREHSDLNESTRYFVAHAMVSGSRTKSSASCVNLSTIILCSAQYWLSIISVYVSFSVNNWKRKFWLALTSCWESSSPAKFKFANPLPRYSSGVIRLSWVQELWMSKEWVGCGSRWRMCEYGEYLPIYTTKALQHQCAHIVYEHLTWCFPGRNDDVWLRFLESVWVRRGSVLDWWLS